MPHVGDDAVDVDHGERSGTHLARMPAHRGGGPTALLAGGTATLVAPVMPVPDAETAALMQSFHGHLRAGLSPPEALATAQAKMWAEGAATGASAAAFVCLGAGVACAVPAPGDGHAGNGHAGAGARATA